MLLDFLSAAPVPGNLDVRWVCGERPATTRLQAHEYEPNTFILRQNRSVSPEAPFLFLLFGNERALLLDTGATKDPPGFRCAKPWIAWSPNGSRATLATATNSSSRTPTATTTTSRATPSSPAAISTTVVPRELEAVRSFFNLADTPGASAEFDLGGRVLDVMSTPGHHPASITIYDRWTGLLLTGDTVYPGRLYAPDMPAFVDSLDRLAAFVAAHPVTHVFGCPHRDEPHAAQGLPARRSPPAR